jgi:hypothetical protein
LTNPAKKAALAFTCQRGLAFVSRSTDAVHKKELASNQFRRVNNEKKRKDYPCASLSVQYRTWSGTLA